MARFRHLHGADENGLHFDWREGVKGHKLPHYHAQLENGDHILALALPVDNGNYSWGYNIKGPLVPMSREELDRRRDDSDDNDRWQRSPGEPEGMASQWLAGAGWPELHGDDNPELLWNGRHRVLHFDNPHSAMKAAEQHYLSMDRRGQAPAAHDLSIYDDISKPAPLDDDFGDIFGGDR